jgi:hypothetical protein
MLNKPIAPVILRYISIYLLGGFSLSLEELKRPNIPAPPEIFSTISAQTGLTYHRAGSEVKPQGGVFRRETSIRPAR